MRKKIFCLFLILIFSFSSFFKTWADSSSYNCYDLVIVAVFQNEAFFLKEWIDYHKLLGVQHFYLYNNRSTDDYAEILKPYLAAGEVDLFDWPIEVKDQDDYLNNLQLPVYTHAIGLIREKAKWAAFIDLDEFIVPIRDNNLVDFLKKYENYAALAINWQMFGTSWVNKLPPNGLIIENLTLKAEKNYPLNLYVKLIVQPQYVIAVPNPHFFHYQPGYYAVNSLGERLGNSPRQRVVIDDIQLNHYWFGTYERFIHHKVPRRLQWGSSMHLANQKSMIENCNQERDQTILRFVPFLLPK